MARAEKKLIATNILVERDEDGFYIVSLHGVQGAHADGETLEKAIKNLSEVVSLLKEYYGERKFLKLVKHENRLFGVVPYELEYV